MSCVLIVEDDPSSLILLEKGLISKGYEVVTATNGVDALNALARQPVDIVVSDIMMPKMDGYELCRRMKLDEDLRNIPFAFYTATFVGDEEERLGLSLGAVDYLVKPMEIDDMHAFIESVLEGDAQTRSLRNHEMESFDPNDPKELYSVVLSRKLEKKVAELEAEKKKLSSSESKFRHLVEDLRKEYFFYQRDTRGVYTYVSPSVSDILGYQESEFLTHYSEHISDDDCNRDAEKQMAMALQGIEQDSYPIKLLHRNGSVHHLEITEHPVFNSREEVVAVEGVAHDVTAFKELERQFLQAQKMEALGTLVGGIAHDFNNILAGMLGAAFLAKSNVQNHHEVVRELEVIDNLGFKAADMIKQLLTFARHEEVDKASLPLLPFFKETTKMLRSGIEEHIRLSLNYGEDELYIKANSTQLQQMLLNLVNNARDALAESEHPEIRVNLRAYTADDEFFQRHPDVKVKHRQFALIEVADNGHGIKADHLDKVFDPFFTTKAVGKGTGLGLAMAYGSVRSHGGAMDVESNEGEGTVFRIYLPLHEGILRLQDRESGAIHRGSGETILIADDDLQLLKTNTAILTDLGYKVLTATDGMEAVKVFATNQSNIGLVIMDVVMPVMNGPMAVKEIRQLNPKVKIVYLTGYDSKGALTAQLDRSSEVVLNKPCPISYLSRLMREQFDMP